MLFHETANVIGNDCCFSCQDPTPYIIELVNLLSKDMCITIIKCVFSL